MDMDNFAKAGTLGDLYNQLSKNIKTGIKSIVQHGEASRGVENGRHEEIALWTVTLWIYYLGSAKQSYQL